MSKIKEFGKNLLIKHDMIDTSLEGCFPNLNSQARMVSFLIFCCLGFFVELLSFDSKNSFFNFFILGVLLQILGTGFIVNFEGQMQSKNYLKENRLQAIQLYFGSIIGIIISNQLIGVQFIGFFGQLIQLWALLNYSATYIPRLKKFLKDNFKRLCNFN